MRSIWRPVGAAVGRLLDDCAVASGSQLTLKLVHDTNTLLWERLKLCGIVRGDGLNLKRRLQNQPRMRCPNRCVNCRVTKFTRHSKPGRCVSYSLAHYSVNPLAENHTDPEKSDRSRQTHKVAKLTVEPSVVVLKRRPQSWKWSLMALPMFYFASASWDRSVVDENEPRNCRLYRLTCPTRFYLAIHFLSSPTSKHGHSDFRFSFHATNTASTYFTSTP